MTGARDVRGRGFGTRAPLAAVLAWIDAEVAALGAEAVALDASAGRVLAAPVDAPRDLPEQARATMDGFALRGAETTGASGYSPVLLSIAGAAGPGAPHEDAVAAGGAVRVATGAPLPEGADAVLPVEYAEIMGDRLSVHEAVAPGEHVRRPGADVRAGERLLEAGRRLRPQDAALLAALGAARVDVVRRPRVRLVVTGSELVAPGASRGPHAVVDSNSILLGALVARDGGVLEAAQRLPDDRERVAEAMRATGVDVVLVTGGSAVGPEDHAPGLLAECGSLAFHGVALRPGSPAGLGWLGDALVCLLPGSPSACLAAYDFLAGRAIRRLGGRSTQWPYQSHTVTVARKLVSAPGWVDCVRVRVIEGGEGPGVEPIATGGASLLSPPCRADGFVVVPADSEGAAPGARVTVHRYDPLP